MQVCTSLKTDNHASTSLLSFFTGRMPFLPPNQQRQSTEGITQKFKKKSKTGFSCFVWHLKPGLKMEWTYGQILGPTVTLCVFNFGLIFYPMLTIYKHIRCGMAMLHCELLCLYTLLYFYFTRQDWQSRSKGLSPKQLCQFTEQDCHLCQVPEV